MPTTTGTTLADHYLQVQALTPHSGISAAIPLKKAPSPDLPLNITLTQAAIFFVLLLIGALGLYFARARRGSAIMALITLAFIASALPVSMYIINRQTHLSSQAVPASTPKNVIVDQTTQTSFRLRWVTDAPEVGVVRVRQTPENGPLNRIISEPEGVDIYTHVLELNNLTPATTYYFEVLSAGVWYDNQGQPLMVKTLPPLP